MIMLKPFFFLLLISAGMFLFSCTKADPHAGLPRTPSGYPYKFFQEGSGPTVKVGDFVKYNETGFKNDSLWYSTKALRKPRATVYPDTSLVGRPIPPPYEALQLMTEGDCLIVYQNLDTFSNLPNNLSQDDDLAFIIHLLYHESKEELMRRQKAYRLKDSLVTAQTLSILADYQDDKLGKRMQTTSSGLKYIIHEQGDGPKVKAQDKLKTHYSGFLMDGSKFDSSFNKGEPFSMQTAVGGVIPGWEEGIAMLNEGGKATFIIPSNLGYGEKGFSSIIPPNADLIFYVEVVEITN
jgi:FKBP-type peptidyl-prolyl cis-trans isomerase FkpA